MPDDVQDDQSTDTYDSWVQGLGVSANSFGSPDTSQADDSGETGGSTQTDTDTSDTGETGDSGGGGSVSGQDDSGQDNSGGDSGQSDLGGDSDSDGPIPLDGQSAQSGDIENALRKANLWNLQDDVAKLMTQAKVPDNVSVKINIVVDKNLNVTYSVNTSPNHPSGATLARLLSGKYSGAMKNAIKAAGLSVTDTLTVNWLTF